MRVFAFCILSGFTLYLFIHTALVAFFEAHFVGGVIISLMVAGIVCSLFVEARRLRTSKISYSKYSKQILAFASVVSGGILTYLISAFLEVGPVVAAGLIGILGALFVKDLEIPVYCGAFVGMVCCTLFSVQMTIAASIIAGLLFVVSEGVLEGFGGRLGTIAFIGTTITVLSSPAVFVPDDLLQRELLLTAVLYSAVAAGLTFYLSVKKGHGPVMASGSVGLAGGIALPAIHEAHGTTFAAVVICASFVGMSSYKRLKSSLHSALAGTVAGLVFCFSTHIATGSGGKLGTIAFGAVLGLYGIERILRRFIVRE